VQLTSAVHGTSSAIIAGETGFITLDGPPGSKLDVGLTFDNSNNTMQWPVDVRYLFMIGSGGEPQYSELQQYVARVPDADPDQISGDAVTKPAKVRSFVMYFTNANGYNEHVYSFRIRSTGAAKILAIGPAGTDASEALLTPVADENGKYMITAVQHGATGVAPAGEVRPIFITLSDVDGAVPFEFTDPIAGVSEDVDVSKQIRMSIHPNPSNTTSTLSLFVEHSLSGVQISLTDIQGRNILSVFNGTMDAGNHVLPIQTSDLPSGTYFVVMRTEDGVVSQTLTVVK
jgi:hypothetical protein